jgi:FixJ family two-component response regulator
MVSDEPKPVDGRDHPVFVVDDDASVRDSLSVLLETLGFEVLTHGSGSQLLADDRRRHAGCLIVDQHMSGMNGLEMLSALQGEGTRAPAILVTGRLDPAIAVRAKSIGVKAVLEKPFSTARLIELVRSSLGENK